MNPSKKDCQRCKQDPCVCIEIRASSLPSTECWRQWAAENDTLRPVLKKFGFEVRDDRDNPGSLIGTACHEGIGAVMQARLNGYVADPLPHALRKFHKSIEKQNIEDMEDKVTPTKDVAIQQIEKLLETIAPVIANIQPRRVEFKVRATIDAAKNLYVSGHPDCYETNGIIDDWKFGKNLSAYDAQLGAYSLMLRSKNVDVVEAENEKAIDEAIQVTGLRAFWAPRRSLKSKLWGVQVIDYDKYKSEQLAEHLINNAAERIEKFKETGDPFAFTPNPNHKLCSKKWCPAWGSGFCEYGRPEKQTDEGD